MEYIANELYRSLELYHHGIKGQKWGIRRFQNPNGTLTEIGKKRYGKSLEKNYNKETGEYNISSRHRLAKNVGLFAATTAAKAGLTRAVLSGAVAPSIAIPAILAISGGALAATTVGAIKASRERRIAQNMIMEKAKENPTNKNLEIAKKTIRTTKNASLIDSSASGFNIAGLPGSFAGLAGSLALNAKKEREFYEDVSDKINGVSKRIGNVKITEIK